MAGHEGPIDDAPGYERHENAVLAYLTLMKGIEVVLDLAGSTYEHTAEDDDSSVRLSVNRPCFADDSGTSTPVWAVVRADRSRESVHVSVHGTSLVGEAAYRRELAHMD